MQCLLPRTFAWFLSLLTVLSLCLRANAVVIVNGDGSGNTVSPTAANNAGTFDFTNYSLWNNIGSLNGATAIYLGNQTVLTAAHVGAGSVLLNNGQTLTPSGSSIQLTDPINGQPADLLLFKVSQSPALPAVQLSATPAAIGQSVLMTGNGWDRNPNLNFWNVSNTDVWTDQGTNPVGANASGYKTISPPFGGASQHIRWGTNTVSQAATLEPTNNTRLFSTDFDSGVLATPYEAQAVDKDSGGSVFVDTAGTWQLQGLIDAVNVDPNRANASFTAVFGEGTAITDLSLYRSQITAFVPEPTTVLLFIAPLVLFRRRGHLR